MLKQRKIYLSITRALYTLNVMLSGGSTMADKEQHHAIYNILD